MHDAKQAMTLGELGRRIRRRWKSGLVALVLTVMAAVGAWAVVGTNYAATAVLTVSPMTTNPFSTAAVNQQINIATERAILGSGEVARMAAKSLGEDVSAATLVQNTSVEAPQGSQVLSVTVVDRDPDKAARHANALAAAYLAFRAKGASDVAASYIETIDKRIADLDAAAKDGSVDSIVLGDLVNQRNDLALVADNPGRIIGAADGSAVPSTPGLTVYLGAGLLGGVIAGLVVAVLRDRLSRKTGSADRLAAYTGRQVLRMANPQDAEGMRWIIRSLRIGSRALHRDEPTVVGVIGMGRAPEERFRAGLARVLDEHGIPFDSTTLAGIAPETIDRGWPTPEQRRGWSAGQTVLIGIPRGTEGARVAALCDRFISSVVLFVDASVKLTVVAREMEIVEGLPADSVCLVFVERLRKKDRIGDAEGTPDQLGARVLEDLKMAGGNAIADREEYSR